MRKRAREHSSPVQPTQHFETTDWRIVQQLTQQGISPIAVLGPAGERTVKLYRYCESADVIRRAL